MSSILQMEEMGGDFHDTSRPNWRSQFGIPAQTHDLLIDLLGKRPFMDQYHATENSKIQKANEDLRTAKEICTQIQEIIPHIVTDDPERLKLLQLKYIATVAPANDVTKAHGSIMSEYLFFLDTFLLRHESARILGKAVLQAWVYSGKAHQQDQSINDAKFQRMIWFSRSHRYYCGGMDHMNDQVDLPGPYIREFGCLPDRSNPYPWDNEGDLLRAKKLCDTHCVYCHQQKGKVLNCGACKKASYCSQDCQKLHWKSGHKALCKAWRPSPSESS